MILGTGIDIIEVERIENALKRWGDVFLNHVFLQAEIDYANSHRFPAQHLAARFAAKEAVFKAMGDNATVRWKDIEITNDAQGKPICVYHNKNFKNRIMVSLSHTKNYAVASAVITP